MALNKAIKQLYLQKGGTVSYIFITPRYDTEKDRFTYKKSILHTKINKECLFNEKGGKVSPRELLKLFQDTKKDLGADKFIIS